MYSRFAALFLGVIVPVGCASVPKHEALSLHERGESLARSICPGPPTRITHVANTHYPDQIDRIETRACPRGTSEIYIGELASNPAGLPMSVEVIAPSAGLPRHLEIGQPVVGAVRALGPPRSRAEDTITYPMDPESDSTLSIRHQDGRISSVFWSWAID